MRASQSQIQTSKKYRGWLSLGLALLVILWIFWRSNIFSASHWSQFKENFVMVFINERRYLWLLKGLKNTFIITLMAAALGIIIGLILSVIRVAYKAGAPIKFLNLFANLYITVIRGTPVMVQLMIFYFVIFAKINSMPRIILAGIAFGINSGAYVAEIFRAGIEAVDPGQMEAGRSLGLPYGKSMRLIILPQAIKTSLPTLFNELIMLIKETSVVGYIGMNDLTRAALNIVDRTYDANLPLLAIAFIYLLIVLGLSFLLTKLERRMARSDRG